MNATLAALFIYPVKSCRGLALPRARLTTRGLEHDREWLIVDRDGRFVTQREQPRLAQIIPVLQSDALQLSAPGLPPINVDLKQPTVVTEVTVWRDTLPAWDQGDEAADWLSRWTGAPLRLARFDPAQRRYCNPDYVGDRGAHHAFADGYPVLVVSEASLADLNSRLDSALPMNRFRPNIVLSGVEAFDEDHCAELGIGRVKLLLVKPCTRCRITTIDQETAEAGVEPLPTLASYRHDAELAGVAFGMNAIVSAGAGSSISVGNAVRAHLDF